MYKKLLRLIRHAWGFSRTEANGFVVLSLLMVFLLFVPYITKKVVLWNKEPLISTKEADKLDSLIAHLKAHEVTPKARENSLNPQLFDPNTISEEELLAFGLPKYLAQRIINYRTKVKPFAKAKDLQKIYGLDSAQFHQLVPYISIKKMATAQKAVNADKNYQNKYAKPYRNSFPKLAPFDLNTADTTHLKKVYGIGPAYAKRIVSFRELLGGYISQSQLSEVYGLESPALDSLIKYTFISEGGHLKININTASAAELAKHPYITNKQASLIVAYRNQHGNFSTLEQLLKIKALKEDFLHKLMPYLTVND